MSVTLEIKYYNTFLIKSSEVTHQVVGTGDGSTTTFTIAESSGSTVYAVPNSETDFSTPHFLQTCVLIKQYNRFLF